MKILLITLLFSVSAFARPVLEQFSSDGCSSWPDGSIFEPTLWKSCCFEHDISYWMGGTEDERVKADEGLRDCVIQKTQKPLAGWVMYSGVRVGGGPGYETPYRWGYGWNYARPYKKLSSLEKKMAEDQLNNSCLASREDNAIIDRVMKRKRMKISTFRKLRN
jgi:hypothetical protein